MFPVPQVADQTYYCHLQTQYKKLYVVPSGNSLHGFADDLRIKIALKHLTKGRRNKNVKTLRYACKIWMDFTSLKMNNGKMEFLHLSSRQQLSKCEVDSINVNWCVIKKYTEVKYLGMWMDSSLIFKSHIERSTMLNLYKIIKICKSLTEEVFSKLVIGLVISHLDSNNAMLIGLPRSFAARAVLNEGK